jgi:hypothetical protein
MDPTVAARTGQSALANTATPVHDVYFACSDDAVRAGGPSDDRRPRPSAIADDGAQPAETTPPQPPAARRRMEGGAVRLRSAEVRMDSELDCTRARAYVLADGPTVGLEGVPERARRGIFCSERGHRG